MYKALAIVSLVSACLASTSGCGVIPIHGPAPGALSEKKDMLRAQIGEHKKTVLATIGVPSYILNVDERTYWIYEAISRSVGVGFISIYPFPVTRKDAEFHCILIGFDKNDKLKRYKSKTVTLGEYIPINYGCACAFFGETFAEFKGPNWVCSANKVEEDPSAQMELYFLQMDKSESLRWLCAAADREYPQALAEVGRLYTTDNIVVKKDLLRAYLWYSLAEERSYKGGPNITTLLSPKELAEAQRLVKDWELHPGQCERELIPASYGD